MFEYEDEVLPANSEGGVEIHSRLFLLLILGFVLIFVGIIIIVFASLFYGNGSSGFGGVIFIGPFPIVFGAGPDAAWLITISLILAILTFVGFWVMTRRIRRQIS